MTLIAFRLILPLCVDYWRVSAQERTTALALYRRLDGMQIDKQGELVAAPAEADFRAFQSTADDM